MRKNRRKKRNRISALTTLKHNLVGDFHFIVPSAEDEDPAAPKETACAYPAAVDKTSTKARVRSNKDLKIEIKYDPDPKSLNHYFPRVTRSETKKETIVADKNDCDDPGVSEENASYPTDDIVGDKDKTQLMVQSQKKSNINLFYDLDPESLSRQYCPLLNRTKKRKQSNITVGDDDDTGTPKNTVLAPTDIKKFGAVDQAQDDGFKDINEKIHSVPALKQKHPLLMY